MPVQYVQLEDDRDNNEMPSISDQSIYTYKLIW